MGGIIHKSRLDRESAFAGLSMVIITLNEARNLPRLLAAAPKLAELVVLDSGSTDQTIEIAKSYNARVEARAFDNYASQKNYAMSLVTKPWTLCLDADELPDEMLWQAIAAAIGEDSSIVRAFVARRRLVFLGRKMRFGRTQDSVVRLFKSHSASYQNEIHETLVVDPKTKMVKLPGTLWHYSYHDLDDYFSKFNRYTSLMATTKWRASKTSPNTMIMAVRLPIDFTIRYFFKLGFIDGWPGFLWAALASFYSLIKYAKLKEISEKVSG